MKVLFIGGNGNISWYCVQKAIEAGYEVYELNRGATLQTRRDIQPEVYKLTGDYRDESEMRRLLSLHTFDIVCDFICFNEAQAAYAVNLFEGRVSQYIFISSGAVYERKTKYLPFTERTPQWHDTAFEYARDKIAAERVFMRAHNETGFPVTIVRPGYTYDTIVPISVGHNCFTAPQRYMDGKPILIAGDGTNVFTFTHSRDFAAAFVHLLGNMQTIGEDYHITSEEWLTWLDITEVLLDLLGVKNRRYIHIPINDILESKIANSDNLSVSFLGQGFMGDRMWCCRFDNSKIKSVAPEWTASTALSSGLEETIKWLFEKDVRRRINPALDALMERMTLQYTNICSA